MNALVKATARIKASPVQARFPFPLQPRFALTDFLSMYGPQNLDKAGDIETDAIADCVYPRPFFVPHNNSLCEYGSADYENPHLPVVCWTVDKKSSLTYVADDYTLKGNENECGINIAGLGKPYQTSAELVTEDLGGFTNEDGIQGWWGRVLISNEYTDSYTPGLSDARPWFKWRFRIGPDGDDGTVWFSIRFNGGGFPEVYTSPDEAFTDGGTKLVELKPGGSVAEALVDGTFEFEVRLIGGILQLKLNSIDTPFCWPVMNTVQDKGSDDYGKPIGLITKMRIVAARMKNAYFECHPMKFKATATLTSKLWNMGFVPQATPEPEFKFTSAFFQPDEVSEVGVVYSYSGPNFRYQLNFVNESTHGVDTYDGTDYSDRTCAYRAVTVSWPEKLRQLVGSSVFLYPEDVQVNQQLNLEDLSIFTSATLVFNNFQDIAHIDGPSVTWGEWANWHGNIAVEIDLLVDRYYPDGTFKGSTGWYRVFTGYGNSKSTTVVQQGGQSKYVMECFGREIAMQPPKFNLPWMDGWNMYFAAAFLASMSGVRWGTSAADTQLAFFDHVPSAPFDDDPTGEQSYFLPMGRGGTPLMKSPAGGSAWQFLGKIGKEAGFIRYFNEYGNLEFKKFLPSAPSPWHPYRTFDVVDGSLQGGDLMPSELSAFFDGTVERDVTQVRNKVTVIGVDAYFPMWLPKVTHRSDDASVDYPITDIWAPQTPNYVGFENPFVWVDSQFAVPEFASDACDAMFAVMRLPAVSAGHSCWLQPDIYPGKWVGFSDARSGLYDRSYTGYYIPMMVEGMSHHVAKGQVPTSRIRSRFFPTLT